MNLFQKKIAIIILNSILLGCGILTIVISNIINSNWFSLITIILFGFSVIFPLLCNALDIGSEYSSSDLLFLNDDNKSIEKAKTFSWFLTGFTITLGYSIPFLLWRNKEMPILNMIMAMSGGSIILLSIIIFIKFVLL